MLWGSFIGSNRNWALITFTTGIYWKESSGKTEAHQGRFGPLQRNSWLLIRYVAPAFFSSLPLFIFPLLEEGVWLAWLGIKGKRSGIAFEFDLEQITKRSDYYA